VGQLDQLAKDPAATASVRASSRSNELPFREELILFLIARSGRALEDFGRWVVRHRPRDWVLRVLQVLSMSDSARDDILRYIPKTDDPVLLARQRHIAKVLQEIEPELWEEVRQERLAEARAQGRQDALDKACKEALDRGRLLEARAGLRRVLARRGLRLTAEQEARIEGCGELATLERWLEEAVVAPSAADVLR
jgi:hypothetical protein